MLTFIKYCIKENSLKCISVLICHSGFFDFGLLNYYRVSFHIYLLLSARKVRLLEFVELLEAD